MATPTIGHRGDPSEVDLLVPVYDRNLSQADVTELIKFYESPTGKKFVSVLPKITQESMGVGEKWGRELAMKVMLKLQQQEPPKK